MSAKTYIVEIDESRAGELAEFAAARSGRIEPYTLILGKYGYLDQAKNHQALVDAAAEAIGLPPRERAEWRTLSQEKRKLLLESATDSWEYMNEGRFEPEEAEAMRAQLERR